MVFSLLTGRCYEAEICANLLLLRCAFAVFAELKINFQLLYIAAQTCERRVYISSSAILRPA